jgi:hypothetical protein
LLFFLLFLLNINSNHYWLLFLIVPKSPLKPELQGLLGTKCLRRSVQREKGPLDLFLFPLHPAFLVIALFILGSLLLL